MYMYMYIISLPKVNTQEHIHPCGSEVCQASRKIFRLFALCSSQQEWLYSIMNLGFSLLAPVLRCTGASRPRDGRCCLGQSSRNCGVCTVVPWCSVVVYVMWRCVMQGTIVLNKINKQMMQWRALMCVHRPAHLIYLIVYYIYQEPQTYSKKVIQPQGRGSPVGKSWEVIT